MKNPKNITTCFVRFSRTFVCASLTILLFISSLTISPPQNALAETSTDDHLVVRYEFNDNTNDISGNGKNAIAYRGPQTGTDRFGERKNVYTFDGIDDFIQATADIPERNFTISLWLKTSASNTGVLSIRSDRGGHDRHFYLHNGIPHHRVWQGGAWSVNNNVIINDGEWHHWVLTVEDNVGQKAYIDGNLVGQHAYDHSDFNWQNLITIGYSYDAIGKFFKGSLDDVRIYSKALSETEINEMYNSAAGTLSELLQHIENDLFYTKQEIDEKYGAGTGGSDSRIGTLTESKLCTSDGNKINCESETMSVGKFVYGTNAGDISYNGGNVGIGTTTPRAKLHVAGGEIKHSATYPGVRLFNINTNHSWYNHINKDNDNYHFRFYPNPDDQVSTFEDKLVITADGNVGINTTTPGAKLDIAGSEKVQGTIFIDNAGTGIDSGKIDNSDAVIIQRARSVGGEYPYNTGAHGHLVLQSATSGSGDWSRDIVFRTGAQNGVYNRMVIQGGGNVGIGTTNPRYNLHVDSGASTRATTLDLQSGREWMIISDADGGGSPVVPCGLRIRDGSVGEDRLIIDTNGNVGISTANPGNYKLAVAGNVGIDGSIIAKEIEMKPNIWADFVFKEGYDLKPLSEVEDYIQQYKHLPEVPSEAEVLENGVSVNKMQALLLQKIEELTLYVIDLEKRDKEKTKQIQELVKRDREYLQKIQELEKQLN
jgi:hypothetical protein